MLGVLTRSDTGIVVEQLSRGRRGHALPRFLIDIAHPGPATMSAKISNGTSCVREVFLAETLDENRCGDYWCRAWRKCRRHVPLSNRPARNIDRESTIASLPYRRIPHRRMW